MMMQKFAAAYDAQGDARAARDRLLELGLPEENTEILDQDMPGYSRAAKSSDEGWWDSIKEMPDEDRRIFEESIRRGGSLLVASVEAERADETLEVLESSNAVDLARRREQWSAEGWTGQDTGVSPRPAEVSGHADATKQSVPIVEERMRVGKRKVDQGHVRVRSFIVEEPVHEEVRLQEEHVDVERCPVNRPAAAGDPADLLHERTVEIQETAEEAVVAKEAVVTEEVRIRKRADERVEKIDDTVRRTEVEIDDSRPGIPRAGTDASRKSNPAEGTRRRPDRQR
jgi:uncharacterized protein (TIGR02271 family)